MATRRRRTPAPLESAETEAPAVPEVEVVEAASAEESSEGQAVALEEGRVVEVVQVVDEPVTQSLDSPDMEIPDFGQGPGAQLRVAFYERGHRFLEFLQLCQLELTPENVHQMRVSSRRLGSSLSLLSSLVGQAPVKRLRRDLRAARRCLGDLRDLQRQLAWLADEPLMDEYLTERAAELPGVIKKATRKLRKVRPKKVEKGLELVDALLAALLEEENAEESARDILSRHVWESLLRSMSSADEVDPDHSFSYHPLRVGMKTFRYQAEVFAAAGWTCALDHNDGWSKVKELHDSLGHLQDLEVLSCHLDLHWVQCLPVRDSQARVINRLLKERHQTLGHIHLQDLDWESLWEWPKGDEVIEPEEVTRDCF
ncbi:CHAD domain-containing protein, partial [bacterium]|nr:CHAD domain-containing protein [bacterium]